MRHHAVRHRLFMQVYLGFVAVALLCVAVAAVSSWALRDDLGEIPESLQAAAELLVEGLPAGPPDAVQEALAERATRVGLHVTLWGAADEPLAVVGPVFPRPSEPGWFRLPRGRGHGVAVALPDGRWAAGALARAAPRPWLHGTVLGALLLAMAAGSWPVARRITRRLEALGAGVERFGAGDLAARVPEEGTDEVAALARSFNVAAERIERLVEAQRRVLANASHELRSPLARLRMAVELGNEEEAVRDIEELDALVGDVLEASRLEALRARGALAGDEAAEPVDLRALLVEEATRVGAAVADGAAAEVTGSTPLVRRMLRNLLDNARRHGGDGPVEAWIEAATDAGDGTLTVVVADRGPGVPEAERERIFEPFYRPQGHSEGRDGGVGLGLALVREIARHHGGDARHRPRDGGGSRLEVTLPTRRAS